MTIYDNKTKKELLSLMNSIYTEEIGTAQPRIRIVYECCFCERKVKYRTQLKNHVINHLIDVMKNSDEWSNHIEAYTKEV